MTIPVLNMSDDSGADMSLAQRCAEDEASSLELIKEYACDTLEAGLLRLRAKRFYDRAGRFKHYMCNRNLIVRRDGVAVMLTELFGQETLPSDHVQQFSRITVVRLPQEFLDLVEVKRCCRTLNGGGPRTDLSIRLTTTSEHSIFGTSSFGIPGSSVLDGPLELAANACALYVRASGVSTFEYAKKATPEASLSMLSISLHPGLDRSSLDIQVGSFSQRLHCGEAIPAAVNTQVWNAESST